MRQRIWWLCALLAACRNEPDSKALAWEGEWAEARVYTSPTNPLAAIVEIRSARDATASLDWDCGHRSGTSSVEIPADGEGTLEVWGVRQRTDCALTLTLTDADGSDDRSPALEWRSGSVPDDAPTLTATGTSEPGMTLLSPVPVQGVGPSTAYAYGADEEGELIWTYVYDEITQERVVHILDDGSFVLHFPGMVRRVSPGGRILSQINTEGLGSSHHDLDVLPDGSIVVMIRESREVQAPVLGGAVTAIGDRLLRIDPEGEVVWEWSAFDHLDTSRFPGEVSRHLLEEEGGYDWTHGNALRLAPDRQDVLYSTRSQSWVVRIDLEDGTGEPEWILGEDGDFTLTSGDWFYSQHAPELQPDDTILIYDNGNDRPEGLPASRAVRYQLDPDAPGGPTAEQIWEYDTDTFTDRLGDANLLPDGYVLVTVGSPRQGDAHVVEVGPDGSERWRLNVAGTDLFGAERLYWE